MKATRLRTISQWNRLAGEEGFEPSLPGLLAKCLVERCKKDGLSFRQVAAMTGLSHGTIDNISKGNTRPMPETLRKLARGLNGNGNGRVSLEDTSRELRFEKDDERTLSYIAGFFDGEGNILVRRVKNKHAPYHRLMVTVANTDLGSLDFLRDWFGGQIHQRKPRSPKHSRCDVWVVICQQAATFLRQILPYLKIKHRQAEIGIELARRQQAFKKGESLTPSQIAIRDVMWQEVRSFNHRKGVERHETATLSI